VGGLLIGGVLMAPIAAKLAGKLPHAPFGAMIGGAVLLINSRIIMNYFAFADNLKVAIYITIFIVTALLAYFAYQREKK
jgi:hypothetical protein